MDGILLGSLLLLFSLGRYLKRMSEKSVENPICQRDKLNFKQLLSSLLPQGVSGYLRRGRYRDCGRGRGRGRDHGHRRRLCHVGCVQLRMFLRQGIG